MEKLYSCDEIAERYGVKRHTVYVWKGKGLFNTVSIGRLWRVRESELEAFERGSVSANDNSIPRGKEV